MFEKGKLDNMKREMERVNINILGVSEVRWTGAGLITSDKHTIIYSGGEKHEKGVGIIMDEAISKTIIGYHAISDRVLLVKLKGQPININIIQVYAPTSESSDEDIDMFYNDVEIARKHCKSNGVSIIPGDFNAKVGHDAVEGVLGLFAKFLIFIRKCVRLAKRFCQKVTNNAWRSKCNKTSLHTTLSQYYVIRRRR